MDLLNIMNNLYKLEKLFYYLKQYVIFLMKNNTSYIDLKNKLYINIIYNQKIYK